MRKFLGKLSEVHQTCEITIYKEYKQLTEKMDAFQVEKLISMFAQIKGTGKIKPGGCVHRAFRGISPCVQYYNIHA